MANDPHGRKFQQQMLNQKIANMQISLANQQQSVGTLQSQSLLFPQTNMLQPHPKPIPRFMRPDPKVPDTMGWRVWIWYPVDEILISPYRGTPWPEAELIVDDWNESDVVRGVSGIHAKLVPKHWKDLNWPDSPIADPYVTGIVERFGKYVLGTEGWRAEWVVIRELMAPSTEIGLKLERLYPDVIVHYPEEEGEQSCTSETSSKSEKGSRPTNRPRPAPRPAIPSAAPSPSSSPVIPHRFLPYHQSVLTQSESPPDFKRTDSTLRYFGALIFWACVLSAICLISRFAWLT